jgi:hypothetical protein
VGAGLLQIEHLDLDALARLVVDRRLDVHRRIPPRRSPGQHRTLRRRCWQCTPGLGGVR